MTDMRVGAPPVVASSSLFGFLAETVASLATRRLIAPVLLLTLLLTATNIVLARFFPAAGEPPSWQFAAAGLVRLVGLFAIAVAVLRAIAGSPRSAWRPDGAFWLYGATVLAGIGVTLAATSLTGAREDAVSELLIGVIVTFVSAPFAAWFTAIAVERPLAWRAGRWLRGFGRWLPQLLFWSLLLLLPLGLLHGAIAPLLVRGGPWFWPVALADGPLSVLLALLGLALAGTAYRSVARG